MKKWDWIGITVMSPWVLLALHQLVLALMKRHGWAGMSPGDWGTWVGSIGTLFTLIGTIWLATNERRQRLKKERDLALVTVAGFNFRIPVVKIMLGGALAILHKDAMEQRATNYKRVAAMLDQISLWSPEELVPLVGIHGHLATRLSFAAAEIASVRAAIKLASEQDFYAGLEVSMTFNMMTRPRLESPIETLDDCFNRCRKFLEDSGFADESPTSGVA